jgi:DNA-binding transcriptional LysR family regulator
MAEACDIVGLMQGSALQDTWDEHAGRRGVRLNYRLRLQSFDALCRVITQGLGVALMPETAARGHALNMSVQVLQLKEAWLSERPVLICMKTFADLPTHTQRLVAHLSHTT